MRLITLFIYFFLVYNGINAQSKDSLFIYYDKKMPIKEYNNKIYLSFSLWGSDTKVSTYNFMIDNLDDKLEYLSFNEIRDTIFKINRLKIKKINTFSKLSACSLHYKFSDCKNIFLIKKEKGIYLKYKLVYWSTQRGWEPVNTN